MIREDIQRVIDDLETKEQNHYIFSQGLWVSGDKPNAHCQEGQSIGLSYAIARLKELLM